MPLGPILLLAFLIVPLIEVALFVQVGGWIGLWPTLLAIVVTALLGSAVIRRQGFGVAQRARGRLEGGGLPVREAFDGLCLVIAGLLMITPGFFTDAVGGALLVPPLRTALYGRLARRIEAEMRQRGGAEGPRREGDVVDVDFEVIDEGESSGADVPPPRGGWDRTER